MGRGTANPGRGRLFFKIGYACRVNGNRGNNAGQRLRSLVGDGRCLDPVAHAEYRSPGGSVYASTDRARAANIRQDERAQRAGLHFRARRVTCRGSATRSHRAPAALDIHVFRDTCASRQLLLHCSTFRHPWRSPAHRRCRSRSISPPPSPFHKKHRVHVEPLAQGLRLGLGRRALAGEELRYEAFLAEAVGDEIRLLQSLHFKQRLEKRGRRHPLGQ